MLSQGRIPNYDAVTIFKRYQAADGVTNVKDVPDYISIISSINVLFWAHHLIILHTSVMMIFRIFGNEKKTRLSSSFLTERRNGRADEWMAKDLMKHGVVVIEDQSFDTQRNLPTDLAGSLKSISMVTSRGNHADDFVLSSFSVSMASFCFVPFPTRSSMHCFSIYIINNIPFS